MAYNFGPKGRSRYLSEWGIPVGNNHGSSCGTTGPREDNLLFLLLLLRFGDEDGTGEDEAQDALAHDTADDEADKTTIGVAEKEKQTSTTLEEQDTELGSKPQTNDQQQATIAHTHTETEEVK